MKFNKLVLATVLATTAFASTSALAAYTRSCEGEVAVHVASTSGQYIGNTSVTGTVSATGPFPNAVRIRARQLLVVSFNESYFNNKNWYETKAKDIIQNSPKGNYNVEVKMRTYSNNAGASSCNSSSYRFFTFVK